MTPKFSFIAARTAWNLGVWSVSAGLLSKHTDDFTAKVLGAIRKEIAEHATDAIAVLKKDGSESIKTVKEFELKQRVSGKILKISNGEKREFFIETCSAPVKALIRQDQALEALERHGAGAYLAPVPNSELEKWLLRHLAEFKTSRPGDYKPKSVETMKQEENDLAGA